MCVPGRVTVKFNAGLTAATLWEDNGAGEPGRQGEKQRVASAWQASSPDLEEMAIEEKLSPPTISGTGMRVCFQSAASVRLRGKLLEADQAFLQSKKWARENRRIFIEAPRGEGLPGEEEGILLELLAPLYRLNDVLVA